MPGGVHQSHTCVIQSSDLEFRGIESPPGPARSSTLQPFGLQNGCNRLKRVRLLSAGADYGGPNVGV